MRFPFEVRQQFLDGRLFAPSSLFLGQGPEVGRIRQISFPPGEDGIGDFWQRVLVQQQFVPRQIENLGLHSAKLCLCSIRSQEERKSPEEIGEVVAKEPAEEPSLLQLASLEQATDFFVGTSIDHWTAKSEESLIHVSNLMNQDPRDSRISFSQWKIEVIGVVDSLAHRHPALTKRPEEEVQNSQEDAGRPGFEFDVSVNLRSIDQNFFGGHCFFLHREERDCSQRSRGPWALPEEEPT